MNNYQKKAWALGLLVGLLLALYLFALMIGQFKSIAYIGSGIQPTNTISVDGTGDAYAVPDIATFSFTVMDTEKTVADAQTKATDKINAALKVVSAAGVADKDIQTQYYSINPQYQYQNAICPMGASSGASGSAVSYGGTASSDGSVSSGVMIPAPIYCPSGKSVLTGYTVSESISVKLRDLSKAGALLVSLGSTGVSDLNGPSFDVDNPDSVQAQARSKAIADAQSKAQELAKELGVRIVRVVSFADGNTGVIRPVMYAMGAVASSDSKALPVPEVPTGQQKVTDNVTITYEIQ